jgi:hypothetical protein
LRGIAIPLLIVLRHALQPPASDIGTAGSRLHHRSCLGRTEWSGDGASTKGRVTDPKVPA